MGGLRRRASNFLAVLLLCRVLHSGRGCLRGLGVNYTCGHGLRDSGRLQILGLAGHAGTRKERIKFRGSEQVGGS